MSCGALVLHSLALIAHATFLVPSKVQVVQLTSLYDVPHGSARTKVHRSFRGRTREASSCLVAEIEISEIVWWPYLGSHYE